MIDLYYYRSYRYHHTMKQKFNFSSSNFSKYNLNLQSVIPISLRFKSNNGVGSTIQRQEPTANPIIQTSKSRKYIGIIFAIICSVSFSLGSFIVKLLTTGRKDSYHPFSIGVWRFLGITITYLPILIYFWLIKKDPVLKNGFSTEPRETYKILSFLLIRWITGASAIVLQFMSLKYMSLSDSLLITFSTPVFIALVSPLVFKERCTILPIIFAVLTLVGVGIILRPQFFNSSQILDHETLIGAAYGISSMICTAISFIVLQKLRKIHYTIMLSLLGIWGTLECITTSLLIVGKLQLPRGLYDWGLGIATTILGIIAQTSLTMALKFTSAGPVSLVRTCDVIFGVIWQGIFTHVYLDWISWLGLIIVLSTVAVTIFREIIHKLPKEHKLHQRFKFLLY